MGSKGVVWRPIATIAAAVGDVELEDQVLRLSQYLGYAKVLLNNNRSCAIDGARRASEQTSVH